ncbi:TPA: hypothetical protein DEF17_09695, partial [bacterium]|nr:hypothetical protein [bacterium]
MAAGTGKKLALLISISFLLTSLADTANALSFSETTKSDLDSYSDSSSIASRSYVAGLGQLELSPIIQVETSALSANAILSLTWQDSASRLWAGGTSGAGGLVLAWRRTPAGLWEAVNFGDTLGAFARSMPVLVSLNNTLYGGISLNLNGGDNCGRLVRWNEGLDTWVLHLNLNASDGDFDGFGRGKMIWNNTAYMSGGRTNNKTFLVSLDGATGDVDFRSLENPRPTGAVAGEYDGALCGFGTYLYTGQERLFYAPLNARAGADVARAKEYGTFPTHIAQLDADNEMEVVQMARLNQSGIGDTLFLLLEGNVAANNVIYTTTDGNSFTGKISKNALGYSGTFGSGGLGVTEAFAMRQFGRDIWIGGTLDTVVRYVGDYDTFVHFFNSNMTSGIREFEYFRGLDGDTWLAIAGANGGGGRIDRFRFSDSGTYISDTRILASDTWLVADSVTINAKANGCTILVSYYFGRDTAELNTRTYGETFSVIGDSRGSFSFDFSHPLPSGRASGNAWKQMLYRVYMQTPNTLITPYFEGLTFYFHQDVTAPETPVVLTPAENH